MLLWQEQCVDQRRDGGRVFLAGNFEGVPGVVGAGLGAWGVGRVVGYRFYFMGGG